MLSVNYGNFLRKSETEKARYEFNRPIISFVVSTLTIFCFTGAVVTGALCAYAYLSDPAPTFSQDMFNRAQTLNTNLSKGIATMKQARPDEINTIAVIAKISESKPGDVMIENIKIIPGHYTVKGFANSQESADTFASSMDFGKGFQCVVTQSSFDKDVYFFTIDAVSKVKAPAKAPASPQNKGVNK